MKDTANPCMIVATLITIVGLSAPFTVPGVTREETEITNFIQKLSFRIFVISDAILLASSAGSILTFLSILTSRYADEDLLYVLPRKLLFGFSSLFLSIVALMVASCAVMFFVFKDGGMLIPVLVSMIASLPFIVFTMQQCRLLYDVVRSNFENRFSLQDGKLSLFDADDEEKSWNLKK
ncbi:uncharacterized protein LOC116108333 [Pistacia vera]|uniref:uncharacterized protein LOC116108333 n=1 Tax=Pistacia vera TaxID=55513 RepID=UPI0012636CF9|nr:uncharacterized protein LOC116108333 [Pistacia vera]